MKTTQYSSLLFTLCIALLFAGKPVSAQDNSSVTTRRYPTIGVKINPLSLIATAFSGSVELGLTPKTSIQIGVQYWGGFIPPFTTTFTRVNGITGSFRYYPSKAAPKGFFIEPFVRMNNIWELDERGTVKAYAGGVTVGKQWFPAKHFSIELFIGPYYSVPSAIGFNPSYDPRNVISKTMNERNPFNGFWIRSGATLGIHL